MKTNKPVAWMYRVNNSFNTFSTIEPPDDAYDEGTLTPLYIHPVKELNAGGEPVKNATYWKRQYNEMSALNDRLKSSLYHANEQIKYLESHPEKYLSLQKVNGELVAVTYTDDEHRIIEVLWEKPPAKILTDEEIYKLAGEFWIDGSFDDGELDYVGFARAILRKAQENG